MTIRLLAIFPDWNSLDSVRAAHSNLELAGLVFFALLVIAEALAHNSNQERRKHLFDSIGIGFFALAVLCEIAGYWYGRRNDELSGRIIFSLDAKAQLASSNASKALTDSETALTKSGEAIIKADTAQRKVGAVAKLADDAANNVRFTQALVSARFIADPKALAEQLKQFKGQALIIRSYINDPEGHGLCLGLLYAAKSAEINPTDECGKGAATVPPITEISVVGPDDKVMESLATLISRTGRLGVTSGPYGKAPHSPELIIFVGSKSPFIIGQTPQTQAAEALAKRKKHNKSTKP